MKKILLTVIFLFCFVSFAKSFAEYLYPVGVVDNENLLLIHQTSLDDLELWLWNIKEEVAFKELNSLFLPSCVQVLPSKKGCSFIDRGSIKIKYFNKRTPRVIDFCEPIYAISSVTWINDELFYFSGKHEGFFKLFLCDISNRREKVSFLSDVRSKVDYLYPQQIDANLFCITKTNNNFYSICKLKCSAKLGSNHDLKFEQCANFSTLTSSKQPLCFLFMSGENNGFCLKFIQDEKPDSFFLSFICCQIESDDKGSWNLSDLFHFQLPKKLLVGLSSERLYDSIYPFLPIYMEKSIYFVEFNHTSQACQISRYDQISKIIETTNPNNSRSIPSSSHLFAPCFVNNSIYCGMSMPSTMPNRSLILSDQKSGIFKCELPEIMLKK